MRSSVSRYLIAVLLLARPAVAQTTGEGFLFGLPKGSVTVRGGFNQASGGSDLFSFFTDQLTLTHRDFGSPTIASDFGFSVAPRIAGVLSVSFSRTKRSSEFRDWLDNHDLPIQQETEFMRIPITLGAKAYLTPPGRSIGRLAWVPSHYAVFAGGAIGAMYYRMNQVGDFIDFDTLRVFPDLFQSSGLRPTLSAFGGVDLAFRTRLAVTVETRYDWARAKLGRDYAGFEDLDLSGLSLTTGITFRY